jgi:hypothetical protein
VGESPTPTERKSVNGKIGEGQRSDAWQGGSRQGLKKPYRNAPTDRTKKQRTQNNTSRNRAPPCCRNFRRRPVRVPEAPPRGAYPGISPDGWALPLRRRPYARAN